MAKAKVGDKVKLNYTGSLEDGTVFNAAYNEKPLEVTIGQDKLIGGFVDSLIGMEEGETKSVKVDPENAYGLHNTGLIFSVDKSKVPAGITPEIGTILKLAVSPEKVTNVAVTSIGDDFLTVDGNHPLAGKVLNFEIKLLEIVAETPAE